MKFATQTIKGHGRGKFLGYPTFNLVIPENFNLKQGIWAARVWLPDNTPPTTFDIQIASSRHPESVIHHPLMGALHYGPVPVFDQKDLSLEIFLLDYHSDAPVPELTFEPLHYLRPVMNFPTQKALVTQITQDVAHVRNLFNTS